MFMMLPRSALLAKSCAAEAHDAGLQRGSGKKAGPLMLMMLAGDVLLGKSRAADAHA